MVERIKILDEIKKRREEAKKQGRLIHPEPLIAEIRRKRKRVLIQKPDTIPYIVITKAGDFIEGVSRNLRSFEFWTSFGSSIAASEIIKIFISI